MTTRLLVAGPWSKGIVNTAQAQALPEGAVLDALNVDFLDDGRAVSRPGYSAADPLTNAHSFIHFSGKTLCVVNGDLVRVTGFAPWATSPVRAGVGAARLSYAERGGEIWWSNGTVSGRLDADDTDRPWVPPTPDNLPLVSDVAGTIPAGVYRLAITHLDSTGAEGAASDIYTYTLAAEGSLVLTLPTAKPGASHFVVYCSGADGEGLQRYSTVPAATGAVTITDPPSGRRLGRRAFLSELPAGDAICFHNGRLLSLKGQFLYYSDPWDYGLYLPDESYLVLGSDGSIMASVDSGVFVAADRTWFYQGEDIRTAIPLQRLDCGAVAGTAFVVPDAPEPRVGWYGSRGVTLGAADGSVTLPQVANGFSAPVATSGSAWVRQRQGSWLVTFLLNSADLDETEVTEEFLASAARYESGTTAVVWNAKTGATSRYGSGWIFNSVMTVEGNAYGLSTDGAHAIDGGSDAGTEIRSVLALGRVGGAESSQIKGLDCAYSVGRSSELLDFVVLTSTGGEYHYPANRFFEGVPGVVRHGGMRGLVRDKSAWLNAELVNSFSGSLEVSRVEIRVYDTPRKV